MSRPDFPSGRVRVLRSRKLRDAIGAPELERLLAQRDADLAAIDQVEALRVRVIRGIEVINGRAAAALALARRRELVLATLAAGATAGAVLASMLIESPLVATLLGVGLLAAAWVTVRSLVRLRQDERTLRALRGRYDDLVRREMPLAELLELSRAIFEEVSAVAGGIGDAER